MAPDCKVPEDEYAIACMRLLVMAQGDLTVINAFREQLDALDQAALTQELARTGADGQGFSVGAIDGGPALLIYYAPALLQRNVGKYEDLSHALRVLAQVMSGARCLWPCYLEEQQSTVTVQIGQLKETDINVIIGNVEAPADSQRGQRLWILHRHNDTEASVQAKNPLQVNALMRSQDEFLILDFSMQSRDSSETNTRVPILTAL